MLAATYARQIGKVVAFSLAAFRQAYNGGSPRGGSCTHNATGLDSLGEPNMALT